MISAVDVLSWVFSVGFVVWLNHLDTFSPAKRRLKFKKAMLKLRLRQKT